MCLCGSYLLVYVSVSSSSGFLICSPSHWNEMAAEGYSHTAEPVIPAKEEIKCCSMQTKSDCVCMQKHIIIEQKGEDYTWQRAL